MKVLFPERFISRHVGGNSTYARKLMEGMGDRNIETGLIPSGPQPAATMVSETLFGLGARPGTVLHYTGDTGPLIRTRTPSVVTVHGVASRWSDTVRTPRQEAIWRSRVRRAIAASDRLITVSESSAQDVAEVFGVNISTIDVIPHGIDAEKFRDVQVLSEAVRKAIGAPYVLYLGNIEPRKNIIELVRGFEKSGLARQGLQLIIAGRPAWNYDDILAEISRTPGVKHIGFVSDSDRIALMQQCELFVFPSIYEGFGFPVLEALAAGAVVLTTTNGSLAEVAGPSLVIPGNDSESISNALDSALHDDDARNYVLENAQSWVDRFDWETSLDHHARIYRALAS